MPCAELVKLSRGQFVAGHFDDRQYDNLQFIVQGISSTSAFRGAPLQVLRLPKFTKFTKFTKLTKFTKFTKFYKVLKSLTKFSSFIKFTKFYKVLQSFQVL